MLDTITVVATKTEEKAIDTLAPVSIINQSVIQTMDPKRLQDIFYRTPGVTFQDRGDLPESSINIRGLQDFGRVAVLIDGARQNYQRSGHNANGSFFLEPELLGSVDVVRGPTANIYGSGAIGGVVSFRTKDVQDILRPGEKSALEVGTSLGSNSNRAMGSAFAGARSATADVFVGATTRTQSDYKDGDGNADRQYRQQCRARRSPSSRCVRGTGTNSSSAASRRKTTTISVNIIADRSQPPRSARCSKARRSISPK